MTNFDIAAEIGFPHRKGEWFRVTGTRGNAKAHKGIEGRLAWIGIDGDARALSSSPDRLRVTRVGLEVAGRSGYLFVNVNHVSQIPGPTTEEERIGVEIMCLAIAGLSA